MINYFKGKKKNWVVVLHMHHCGDMGYRHEFLKGATKKEAEGYALIKAKEWQGSGIPSVTGIAIEIPSGVQNEESQDNSLENRVKHIEDKIGDLGIFD